MFTFPMTMFSGGQTWPTWTGTLDGSSVQFEAGTTTATTLTDSCLLTTDTTLVVYRYNSIMKAVIVTTSGKTTPTINTPITVSSNSVISLAVCKIDSTRAMLLWYDQTTHLQAVVLSVSGTTITKNTSVVVDSSTNSTNPIAVQLLTTDQCVAAYRLSGTGNVAVCLSTSVNTITVRTPFTFSTQQSSRFVALAPLTSTTMYVAYDRGNSDNFGMNNVLSVSTNTISIPTAESTFNSVITGNYTVTALDSSHVIGAYIDQSNSSVGKAITSSISGTTITNGSIITFDSTAGITIATQNNAPGLATIDSSTTILTYTASSLLWGVVLSVAGTTTTANSKVNLLNGLVTTNANRNNVLLSSTRVLSLFSDSGNSGVGTCLVLSII